MHIKKQKGSNLWTQYSISGGRGSFLYKVVYKDIICNDAHVFMFVYFIRFKALMFFASPGYNYPYFKEEARKNKLIKNKEEATNSQRGLVVFPESHSWQRQS